MQKTIILAGLDQALHARKILNELPLPKGKEKAKWAVTFEPAKKARSRQQNSRYWAVLTFIAQQKPLGLVYLPEVWHVHFAKMFLEPIEVFNPATGELEKHVRSTTGLGTKKFNKYMEDIEHYCYHEWDIILPAQEYE